MGSGNVPVVSLSGIASAIAVRADTAGSVPAKSTDVRHPDFWWCRLLVGCLMIVLICLDCCSGEEEVVEVGWCGEVSPLVMSWVGRADETTRHWVPHAHLLDQRMGKRCLPSARQPTEKELVDRISDARCAQTGEYYF
jgi:hypothetical protein